MTSIAVLGAGGTMGAGMARNLASAGMEVRAWNRTRKRAEPLAGDGIAVADAPAEAAEGADVVLTILSDADAVIESMDGVTCPTWIQASTIGLTGTERCAQLAEQRGITLIDSPVLGTKAPAEQGELIVLASGPEDAHERVQPVFDAIGKKTMWVGEAGAGSRLKLVTNNWILAVVEATAETVALAEGLDVDPEEFLEAVAGGPLDLPYLQMKAKAMLEGSWEPSMRLALAAKDAALVTEAAERHGLDLPLPRLVRERMEAASGEHGDKDMAATYLTVARR
jgi:3-hydroxyisobutyrate dehydrogenase